MLDELQDGFNTIMARAGKPIRIKYYYEAIGSVYDDNVVLTQSGNAVWTSGVVLPLNTGGGRSSTDLILVEQGKLAYSDQKLYVNGSLQTMPTNGSVLQVKIGLGSPVTNEFSVLDTGALAFEVGGTPVYKKIFIRRLDNGSFIGE